MKHLTRTSLVVSAFIQGVVCDVVIQHDRAVVAVLVAAVVAFTRQTALARV